MREFTSTGSGLTANRQFRIYHVEADKKMDRESPDIIGQTVLIDGVERLVSRVEKYPVRRPIRKGEWIGLAVRIENLER